MSLRTLFLVSSYAFNAPTLNDCCTTSLLETLPLLSKLFPWRTKKTGEQCCCQPDFLFKTMAEKSRPREGKRKRRIIIFLWHSPKTPGESHLPGLLCLTENSGLLSRYTCCFSILLQGDSGGRQTKRWHQFQIHIWQDHTAQIHFFLSVKLH